MFTGIIEEIGEIVEIHERSECKRDSAQPLSKDTGEFRTIHVRGRSVFDDLKLGSSIAVNGVCLTVRSLNANTFSAEMSRETLARTSLGNLSRGAVTNLE